MRYADEEIQRKTQTQRDRGLDIKGEGPRETDIERAGPHRDRQRERERHRAVESSVQRERQGRDKHKGRVRKMERTTETEE